MAKKIVRIVHCEVAPSPVLLPFKLSQSPSLETIREDGAEEEQDCDLKIAELKFNWFFEVVSPVLLGLSVKLLKHQNRVSVN